MPQIAKGSKTKLVPIVSSVKSASVLLKMWDRKSKTTPDAVVVEGPKAGGHLGFKPEELEDDDEAMDSTTFDTVIRKSLFY